ncbi:MAG TPA: hypothetical protein VM345_03770 [Acidimicrobiales bacterium]|nr:hypothetical protein [Acidimicrobiales bacterium]
MTTSVPVDDIRSIVGAAARLELRRPGGLRRFARTAIGGNPAGDELVVDDRHPELRTFLVELPDADDLLAAPIAEAITTTIAIRRRFGRAVEALRRISFDVSDPRMVQGHVIGAAQLNLSTIHLIAPYATASGVAEAEARTGRPVLAMSRLVAHELWHLIEIAWEVRDYRATVEFRRDLGRYFGVETIEHAVRGDDEVRARLAAEVSDYATTTSKETTAEMFEQWWNGEQSPAVAHFGATVDRYFPPPPS